jgi:hypothetical protein
MNIDREKYARFAETVEPPPVVGTFKPVGVAPEPAPTDPRTSHGAMTQREVAAVLGITQSAVNCFEQRALRKLRRDKGLRELAEMMGVIGCA